MKQLILTLAIIFATIHGCHAMEPSSDETDLPSQPAALRCMAQPLSRTTQEKMIGCSWKENCPVPLTDLCEILIPHWGFDDCVNIGTMIVHKAIACDIIAIFQELFQAHFPIEKIQPIDVYNADDDASMSDNNSSAFCSRPNTNRPWIFSLHSFGIAIDINPRINPFVKPRPDQPLFVAPANGIAFLDRTQAHKGIITNAPDNACYASFTKHGFEWGGDWDPSVRVDYQHFQKKLPQTNLLPDETVDSSSYILRQLETLLLLQQQKHGASDEKAA